MGCHALLHGDLPDPGIEPGSLALQADSLLLSYAVVFFFFLINYNSMSFDNCILFIFKFFYAHKTEMSSGSIYLGISICFTKCFITL